MMTRLHLSALDFTPKLPLIEFSRHSRYYTVNLGKAATKVGGIIVLTFTLTVISRVSADVVGATTASVVSITVLAVGALATLMQFFGFSLRDLLPGDK